MNIAELHQLFLISNGVCTDTRKIEKNTMFFALKGERFNGNTYAEKALESGAHFAIIDEEKFKISNQCIVVNDVLTTLQNLAEYHRQYLGIPVIALTGSNGKTTTKELINCVLSTKYKTTATIGNLNNHIGVPLTILSMNKETQIGIVEMGANHLDEIDFLCNIAKPDYGYITNIGKAHLEGFGGIEGVLKGKTELYRYLKKFDKLIFSNLEDEKLGKASSGMNVYSFSQSNSKDNDVTIELLESKPNVVVSFQNKTIESNLIGAYNFTNIATAITIGNYFDVDFDNIKVALESYIPTNNRSQIIQKGNYTIIMDAYNANPTSMNAAIDNLNNMDDNETKIVFLGDMFELGNEASVEHQKIVDKIKETKVQEIHLIGSNFFAITSNSPKISKYKSYDDLSNNWSLKNPKGIILIKGSRGMKLERILDLI